MDKNFTEECEENAYIPVRYRLRDEKDFEIKTVVEDC